MSIQPESSSPETPFDRYRRRMLSAQEVCTKTIEMAQAIFAADSNLDAFLKTVYAAEAKRDAEHDAAEIEYARANAEVDPS